MSRTAPVRCCCAPEPLPLLERPVSERKNHRTGENCPWSVGHWTDGKSDQESRFAPGGVRGIAMDGVERCFAVATITGVIVFVAGLIWLALL
jgi:hypothetical protein